MNSKKLSEAMGELDSKYVDEAINYKKKARKPVWAKWGTVAACLALVCVAAICLFPNNNDSVTTPGIADAAPMIYVNDTLYRQSTSQTSFNEMKDDFVYLGIIESFLDTLTVENRVIFMRRYWFSDSCKDIAEFVGLSEKNISVRLTRIRQKMKDYLAEREVFV